MLMTKVTWKPKFHMMYNLKLCAKLYIVWKFSCDCQLHIKYNFHLNHRFCIKYALCMELNILLKYSGYLFGLSATHCASQLGLR